MPTLRRQTGKAAVRARCAVQGRWVVCRPILVVEGYEEIRWRYGGGGGNQHHLVGLFFVKQWQCACFCSIDYALHKQQHNKVIATKAVILSLSKAKNPHAVSHCKTVKGFSQESLARRSQEEASRGFFVALLLRMTDK
jgi:hypothetical protein